MKHWFALCVLAVSGCGSSQTAEPAQAGPFATTRPTGDARPTQVASTSHQPPTGSSQSDPKAIAEAQDLLKQGLAAYHIGEYDEAEQLLKRSVTIYPFLAPANLALGKIFLLKGAANHDETLIQSARLMFDMAHNIDPSLREPLVLLELFKPRAN